MKWILWCVAVSIAAGCGDNGAERHRAAGSAGGARQGEAGDAAVGSDAVSNAGTGSDGAIGGSGAGQCNAGNRGVTYGGNATAGQSTTGTASAVAGFGGGDACEKVSFSASSPEALAWQAGISQRIAASADCRTSVAAECTMATKSLDRGDPWCASVGRRILHIDDFGYSDFERNHSRILAYLNSDPSLGYIEWKPNVTMQEGRFSFEQEIGRVAFALEGLKPALATLSERNPYPSRRGHGDGILHQVHKLAPYAQSLVAPFPSMDCDPEVARSKLRQQARALTESVARYGVRYIVMSGGATRRHFENCSGDADQLLRQQLDEFYAPLAAVPGTIFIQSAVDQSETDRELSTNDPEFLVDCTPIPGRIRVSYAAIPKRAVPPEGLPYSTFQGALSLGSKNTVACVDLFIAFFDQDAEFLGTSFVPPLAAAMAIAAENADSGRLGATGSERVKKLIGDGAPRLYDPRGNYQFEAF